MMQGEWLSDRRKAMMDNRQKAGQSGDSTTMRRRKEEKGGGGGVSNDQIEKGKVSRQRSPCKRDAEGARKGARPCRR